ncbi:DUF86 domain-containing protein [Aeromicrobium sp. UC242_57]|uniref:DUF86 domain-containing protein n=1 Tax=Aeromicrobium sp. UC242_57 TaxID=3374624 RepID=UPI003787BE8B
MPNRPERLCSLNLLLWDLGTAAKRIQNFVSGKSWNDYSNDLLLRSGVERQFEIAGEAMSKLRRVDTHTTELIPNVHKIIGMRNILIHGYAQVNDQTVWRTATENLDEIVASVDVLLEKLGRPDRSV